MKKGDCFYLKLTGRRKIFSSIQQIEEIQLCFTPPETQIIIEQKQSLKSSWEGWRWDRVNLEAYLCGVHPGWVHASWRRRKEWRGNEPLDMYLYCRSLLGKYYIVVPKNILEKYIWRQVLLFKNWFSYFRGIRRQVA